MYLSHANTRGNCPVCAPLIEAMRVAAAEKTAVELVARRNSRRYKEAFRNAHRASDAVVAAAADHNRMVGR